MSTVIFLRDVRKIDRRYKSSLSVERHDGTVREYNVRDLAGVVVIGVKPLISAAAITLLTQYNIPVSIVTKYDVAIIHSVVKVLDPTPRIKQYTLDSNRKLRIALEIVSAKLRGMQNILKYHYRKPPELKPPELVTEGKETLLTWEATNSRKLWRELIKIINEDKLKELKNKYGFTGRVPRHPDPFNKALSLNYATLYTIATKALLAAGLDVTYGLHHKTRYSTQLTYDYTEMFKPIAIHATIRAINKYNLELDETKEYLTKDSTRKTTNELFKLLTAKIKGTRTTPYRQIYLKAFRLKEHLEEKTHIRKITFTYNPRKLKIKKNTA